MTTMTETTPMTLTGPAFIRAYGRWSAQYSDGEMRWPLWQAYAEEWGGTATGPDALAFDDAESFVAFVLGHC